MLPSANGHEERILMYKHEEYILLYTIGDNAFLIFTVTIRLDTLKSVCEEGGGFGARLCYE